MIVITTPTGQIGRQVLDRLVDGPEPLRVIAREPARLPPRVRERAEVVPSSHEDAEVVTAALAGADSLFWVVPPDPGATSIPGHVLRYARSLCAALDVHSPRIVGVSSLGRGVARNAGQISAIFAMDALIESAGVDYRALCMPGFMDNMLRQVASIRDRGVFFQPGSADRPTPTVATRDIAATAAELLRDDSWTGQQSVPLLGPEDLTWDDTARIMSEALDRPIRVQRVPAEAYRASLVEHGMTAAWAEGIVRMTAAVDGGGYAAETRDPHYPTPTTFRQWCAEVLRPAVRA
ncbi:NAD(P)H-binding protein [Plantactinospora siamensis]|uniref:NAD(P)H-binding protein n=1 Tax=Plantactinospora siamensis TaxID=555372 RepID=A0ABV6NVY3_9ACTN